MNPIPVLPPNLGTAAAPVGAGNDAGMREAARKLETTFLSEMLKAAGFQVGAGAFGGGVGEGQFTSFLRDAQAKELVEAGGIGLAESLFNAMRKIENAR